MHVLVKKLEVYRLENRISQEKLARSLGVAFSTVNRWFNKKSEPSKIQIFHIDRFLKKGLQNKVNCHDQTQRLSRKDNNDA